MDNIRETFAKNLRENRRKNGLTQAQLAEKAEVSTHRVDYPQIKGYCEGIS